MKVEVKISEDIKKPYAVIYAGEMSEELQNLVTMLSSGGNLPVEDEKGRTVILQTTEIFLARVEGEKTHIYCREKSYTSGRRLYELEERLGPGFIRISKSALVNLKQVDSVEPSFNGVMKLNLKNGGSDYISRKYLPEFKRALGIGGGKKHE